MFKRVGFIAALMTAMLALTGAVSYQPIFPQGYSAGAVNVAPATGTTSVNLGGTCSATGGSKYSAIITSSVFAAPSSNTIVFQLNGATIGVHTFSATPFTTSSLAIMLMPVDSNGNPTFYCPPGGQVSARMLSAITSGDLNISWQRSDF